MKWILAMLLSSSVTWAHPSKGYTDGNDLRDQCGAAIAKDAGFGAGACLGFIEGFRQLAVMTQPVTNLKLLCLPDGVPNGQLAKVIVKYLDQHPEKLHLPAAQLMYDATDDAFPCAATGK